MRTWNGWLDRIHPMPAQPEYSSTNVAVFGSGGSGKTTWAARYLRATPFQARFIFDPIGSLCRYLDVPRSQTEAQLVASLRTGWAAFDPAGMFPSDYEAGSAWFADWSFRWSERLSGRKAWACDELWRFMTSTKLPAEIRTVMLAGRNYGMDFVAITHRPTDLHPQIRPQIDLVAAFSTTVDGEAARYLEARGFDLDRLRRLRPAKLRQPPCGEFVVRTLNGGEYSGALYPGASARVGAGQGRLPTPPPPPNAGRGVPGGGERDGALRQR